MDSTAVSLVLLGIVIGQWTIVAALFPHMPKHSKLRRPTKKRCLQKR